MSRTTLWRWLLLTALLGGGAWIIATRLTLTYDLAFFLPQPTTEAQQVLIDRVGQGPGSQMLFVVLPGADRGERDDVAQALRDVPGVRRVLPQAFQAGIESIPEPVLTHRYLLTEVDTTTAGLRRALVARLRDLGSLDDPAFLDLVAVDPHLASVAVLEALGTAPPGDALALDDGTPFLVLDTAVPAFDLGAQQQLLAGLRGALAAVTDAEAGIYGAGAYGLQLQRDVRRESTLFSVLASAAVLVLLALTYRSLRAPLLALLPLAAGAVAGLAALALAFPAVHGITLAFGFTLLGVTVDYALHVMSHVRGGRPQALRPLAPTLLLSVASSALAFLAFTLSGSRGLIQLGVFSAVGILTAAGAAWLLLSHAAAGLGTAPVRPGDGNAVRLRLRVWPPLAVLVLAGGVLMAVPDPWNDDLSTLTPVPARTLDVDRQLRQRAGAPDLRYLLVSRGATETEVLDRVARLGEVLDAQVSAGALDGYRTVTTLVPALETQNRRREGLGAGGLKDRLAAAAESLPLRPEAFEPFVAAVARTASGTAPVTRDSYRGTALQDAVDALLYPDRDGWTALTFLTGLSDPEALVELPRRVPRTILVDLQSAARSLLEGYRGRLLGMLGGAVLMVALVLALALGSWRRWLWVLATVLASLAATVAAVSAAIGPLSLFDLVAATLVAGLGLDYALFFSRPRRDVGEDRNTRHALAVCCASTTTVFALLALSTIPVLHGIGVTVAVGVIIAYALARFGCSASPAT